MRRTSLCLAVAASCFFTGSSDAVEYVIASSQPVHCASIESCAADAACPAGLFAYGGGIIGDQIKTESSYPRAVGGANGWRVNFRGAFYEFGSSAHANATAYVICGPNPGGYTTAVATVETCSHNVNGSCVTGATCPTGWTLLSGGVQAHQSQIEHFDGQGDLTFVVTWYPDRGDFGDGVQSDARAYAVCGNNAPTGFSSVLASAIQCPHNGTSCSSLAACPAGSVVVGGGFYGDESKVESMGPINATTWKTTWYPAVEELGDAAGGWGHATAYCATGTPPNLIFTSGFD